MALIGKLKVNGEDVKNRISSVEWGIAQNVLKGKVRGNPEHVEEFFTIRNIDNSVFYYNWAKDTNLSYNAIITFENNDGKTGIISTLKLNNAICSGFSFDLDENEAKEVMLMIRLSAESIDYVKGTI